MALPVVISRPEKIINFFNSKWNSATLPIQYTFGNDKFPENTLDDVDSFGSVSDNNGYAQINLITGYEVYVAKEWIYVEGWSNYEDGPYQIKSVSGSDITLFISYNGDDTGTVQRYYNNYTLLIRVYSGLPAGHVLEPEKPTVLVTTLEQVPFSNNVDTDISGAVRTKVSTENLINEFNSVDWNLFTSFYVEVAERYDAVVDGEVVNFTSDFVSDIGDILFASHGVNQFQSSNGGNMYQYVSRPFGGDFITDFEEPVMFSGRYYDISILSDDLPASVLEVKELDINGVLINTFDIDLSYLDEDSGVYRFPLSVDLLMEETDKIQIVLK